ncbi:hypothetical protein C8Q78DRAFT_566293 [Trametes maxima]|nr:hypothetical protein C8Q78DRAFT_566293 [Trametes maxima]
MAQLHKIVYLLPRPTRPPNPPGVYVTYEIIPTPNPQRHAVPAWFMTTTSRSQPSFDIFKALASRKLQTSGLTLRGGIKPTPPPALIPGACQPSCRSEGASTSAAITGNDAERGNGAWRGPLFAR